MCKATLKAAELHALLEELMLAGSQVDLSVATKPLDRRKVEIEQVGGIYDSKILELEDGRVACMADIVVTNQSSRPIHIIDAQLRTDWSDWEWLVPRQMKCQGRANRGSGYFNYCFPGKCGLELDYDLVINHLLVGDLPLPSRRPLEGFLLATGTLMPAKLRHGQWLELILALIASDHTEYTTSLQLWTERLEVRTKSLKLRSGLFPQAGKEPVTPPSDGQPARARFGGTPHENLDQPEVPEQLRKRNRFGQGGFVSHAEAAPRGRPINPLVRHGM